MVLNVGKCPCRKVLKKHPVTQLSSKSSPSNQEWHLYSVGWSSWWGWLFTSPHSKYKTFSIKRIFLLWQNCCWWLNISLNFKAEVGHKLRPKSDLDPAPFSYRYIYMGGAYIWGIYICAIFIRARGLKISAKIIAKRLLRHFHPGKKLKDLGISGIFEPSDIFMKIEKSF